MKISQTPLGIQIDLSDSDYQFKYDAVQNIITLDRFDRAGYELMQQLKTSQYEQPSALSRQLHDTQVETLSKYLKRANRGKPDVE